MLHTAWHPKCKALRCAGVRVASNAIAALPNRRGDSANQSIGQSMCQLEGSINLVSYANNSCSITVQLLFACFTASALRYLESHGDIACITGRGWFSLHHIGIHSSCQPLDLCLLVF